MACEWYQRLPAGPGVNRKLPSSVGRHQRGTLLFRPIHIGRNQHAMPVHKLLRIGIVNHLNGHRLAFAHAQNWPGRRAIVANGRKDMRSIQFNRHWRDTNRVIRLLTRRALGYCHACLRAAPNLCRDLSAEKAAAEPEDADETAMPVSAARRFVALYFDDVNTPFENLARARDAADHFLTQSVQPGDRVALFTSSGQKQVDFTDNLAQLRQALIDLRPRPIMEQDTSCGAIPPYEAYQIVEHQDAIAIDMAADEIATWQPCPYPGNAPTMRLRWRKAWCPTRRCSSLNLSETQSTAALRGIESIVRVLTSLPGQRSMVIVSGGFLTETLHFELSEITDRALRAGVIINAIDARGLYTDPTLDASQGTIAVSASTQTIGQKHLILMESARVQTEGMRDPRPRHGGHLFR